MKLVINLLLTFLAAWLFLRSAGPVTHGRINQENHSVCGFGMRQAPEGRILAGLS
jgi:hypothetical protein